MAKSQGKTAKTGSKSAPAAPKGSHKGPKK